MDERKQKPEQGVYHKSVQGGKWFILGTIFQKAINIIPFLILARILLPEDYGVITVVFTVTSFMDRFSHPGFGTALLQRQGSVEKYLDVVWTYDLLKSFVIAIIIFFGGGFISDFFHVSQNHELIIRLSGLFVVIASLSNNKQIYFFKDLDFKKVFLRDSVGQIVYVISAVAWALLISTSAWALFFGYVGRYITGGIMSYVLYPNIPRLDFRFRLLKDLFGYGKWIYIHTILEYLVSTVDTILVGRLLNTNKLGLYSRARDLPTTISWPILSIMNKVAFSAYAKIQDELGKVQEGFLKSLDVFFMVSIPFSLLLVFEGGSIVSVLLGRGWLSMVLPLKILAAGNVFLGLVTMVKPLLNAIGRPGTNVKISFLQLFLSSIFVYFGILWRDLIGAALAMSLAWFVLCLFVIFQAKPILRIAVYRFKPIILSTGVASLSTFILALSVHGYAHAHFSNSMIFVWAIFLGIWYVFVALFVSKKMGSGPWFTLRSIYGELKIKQDAV